MEHFVAYHKLKEWGAYPFDLVEFEHYSGKHLTTLKKMIGQRIWVISGGKEAGIMTYRLVSTYVVSHIKPTDSEGHWVVGNGISYTEPGVLLNEYPWLNTLLREQRNFSYGLNRIRDEGVKKGFQELLLPNRLVDSVPEEAFIEGECKQVTRNLYERNREARRKCLAHYGYTCVICAIDFEKQYGEIGSKFIHVHHLVPIAQRRQEYKIDPVKDLRPVCPNCHSILHKKEPPYSIEELRAMVRYPFRS